MSLKLQKDSANVKSAQDLGTRKNSTILSVDGSKKILKEESDEVNDKSIISAIDKSQITNSYIEDSEVF